MIFPATDSEIKSLDGKHLYYGYFMDMPDENLYNVLKDRPLDLICEKPKIYRVKVNITESTYEMRLQLTNHLDEFQFDSTDTVYTDYPMYNKDGEWYSSYDSLILGYTKIEVQELLVDRLVGYINQSIKKSNHKMFKWYVYCLNIISLEVGKIYTDKYPELYL